MKYSFIIPVFNRPNEVDELLQSLTTQTLKDFDVLVVEDGSTLPCQDVVARYASQLAIHYYNKPNSGPGQTRNYGVQRATGEYVLILDSDVVLLKRFDDFLDNSFFSSMEYHTAQIEKCGTMQYIDAEGRRTADKYIEGIQIQAAVMGAEKGCPFVKKVMDWYADKHFVNEDGSIATNVLSPYIYARVAEGMGFLYKDIDQQLPGRIHIYPSETFAGNKHEVTPNSYAIHLCAHSWHMSPMEKIRKWLGIKEIRKRS